MIVRFEYHLVGHGWSDAALQIGSNSISLTASYLSDALGDLVSAVAAVAEGAPAVKTSFVEEPGEFVWTFDSVNDSDVQVRIAWFNDWPSSCDIALGEIQIRQRPVAGCHSQGQFWLDALNASSGRTRDWTNTAGFG
jgi:hypothetical protein